jgi:tetratricopeptide (TPR) repeat protein
MFARLRSRQGSAYVFTNLGELSFAEGHYEHALTQWQSARQLYRDMDDGQGLVETLLQLAQVRLVVGDSGLAGSMLDEADALMKERGLNTFTPRMLFLRGVHMLSLTTYDDARTFFRQSGQSSPDEAEHEQGLLLKVRMAECEYGLGELDAAVTLALSARDAGERLGLPLIVAEASFVLGTIAASSPARVPERALAVFRRGLDAIAQEPVTELTWKLAFALGHEFHKRGQSMKAQQSFTNARLVLQFFLAHFSSSELKNSYLAVDEKQKVLAALDTYLTR